MNTIAAILDEYAPTQRAVIDTQNAWHDTPTPENLTAWVNAMEKLNGPVPDALGAYGMEPCS